MAEFEDSEEFGKIFKFARGGSFRIQSRESGWLEFKESFNWLNRSKYAKSIGAFANNQGGYLVFGVKDLPRELVGLQGDEFDRLDEQIITQYLNSLFSPEIEYEKVTVEVKDKDVGIIYVHESPHKPIMAVKTDGDVKEGDILYRYVSRSERIKFPELKAMMDGVKEDEKKRWITLLEKIGQIGPERTAVLDTFEGTVHSSGAPLIIDEKIAGKLKFIKAGSFTEGGAPTLRLVDDVAARPVIGISRKGQDRKIRDFRLTEDRAAPVVRVQEETILEKFPLGYDQLTSKLRERFSDFKSNEKYHRIRKQLMEDPMFCRKRYLDPKNPKSQVKMFFSEAIVERFDEHYAKRQQ